MIAKEFELLVTEILNEEVKRSGEVLYSSIETIKKGDIYLMGTNPGGGDIITIKEDLELLYKFNEDEYKSRKQKTNYNGYFDDNWQNGNNKSIEAGVDTLQIKMKNLFERINYNLRDVCSTNLIFFTTQDVNKIKSELNMTFKEAADICWPVHEKLLKIISPRIVISFGNSDNDSPYSYLKRKFNISIQDIDKIYLGYGKYYFKIFRFENITYIFMPHLSRFSIKNDEVYDYIKKFLRIKFAI